MKLSKRPLQNIKNIRSSHVVVAVVTLFFAFGLLSRLIPGGAASIIDSINFLFTPGLLEVQNMEDATISPFSNTSSLDVALNNSYRLANMYKIGFWGLLPLWILSFLFKKPDHSEEISNVYGS